MALKTMSVEKLIDLKQKVEAALSIKVSEQRRTLEAELAKLDRFGAGVDAKHGNGRGDPRGEVAPKYRNPKSPAETWSGRGLKPRWLAAAVKAGKKLEDFSIAGTLARGRTKAVRKKIEKAKK